LNAGRDVSSGISERDAEVIRTIEEEGLSVFTFDGLRRITGAHPETLSRTLERLEEDGIVIRSPEGYSTTDKAKEMVAIRPAYDAGKRVQILRTYLPYGASTSGLVSALKGRWFDRMRWVGISEAEDGTVLKWVTDDGSALIDARLSMGMLDVEAKLKSDADLPKAVRAAHQLVGRISRLYSSTRPGGKSMLMQIGYFRPYAM
jgi:DNA-binding transcriptional ArsR family regulator